MNNIIVIALISPTPNNVTKADFNRDKFKKLSL